MSLLAEKMLKLDEGLVLKPYYCTERVPTIGYGRVIGKKGDPLPNITANKAEEEKFLRERVRELSYNLMSRYPNAWSKCNQARQAVLIGMAYQLGFTGLSQFRNMWQALSVGDFKRASDEMLNSKWAKQTPNRAKRYAEQMLKGDTVQYYLTNGELP